MMNFKSYYKTKLKNSVPAPRTPAPEVKLPPPLPRSSSIKINTKAAQPPQQPQQQPQPSQPARPAAISKPTPPADTIVAAPGASRPLNGTSSLLKTGVKLESQSGVLAKRPRPEKGDQVSTPKRPKVEGPSSSFERITALPKKRRIVTLRTSNPKRLAVILGHTKTLSSIPNRTALPSAAPKEQPALGLAKDINALKPARKPLPSGDIVRKPLPMGGSSSSLSSLGGSPTTTSKIFAKHRPPMPGPKAPSKSPSKSQSPSKSATPPVPSQPAAAAAAVAASAPVASARPKIKIIRKPQPTQAPPAP